MNMLNDKNYKEILNNKETINDLRKVKKYLDYHPLSTILEVTEKTNVSISKILIFIKNGFIKIKQFDRTFISKNN